MKNKGDFSETFNVALYANSTAIGTQAVTDLALDTSTTLTFTWNTTSVSTGNYTMSATAEPVPDETVTADKTLVDGTVHIRIPGTLTATAMWIPTTSTSSRETTEEAYSL